MATGCSSITTTTTDAGGSAEVITLHPPTPKEKFRKDYKPSEYRIKHVDLDFQLHDTDTVVTSLLLTYRASEEPVDLILDGEDVKLVSVALHTANVESGVKPGEETAFPNVRALSAAKGEISLLAGEDEGKLSISKSVLPAKVNELFKLEIKVRINPSKNLQLSGLYKSGPLLTTQCEAEGFRRITFFLDRPDVMATYRVRLEADKSKYPVLLSNGNQLSAQDLKDGRHEVIYADDFVKPSYLFAVVAGDLALKEGTHVRPDGRPVALKLWCEPKEKDKLDYALQALKLAMKWDEDVFGRVYDLDVFNIVAVQFFNMGAMENKSLNIFNSALLLASKDTATDENYFNVLRVVAHEYFHNWTGNRITCRDWFQLTLKEGLTVYRDQRFSRDMESKAAIRIGQVIVVRSSQFTEDAGPMAHPIRPESYIVMDNFYTSTVYRKGAEVIRMYEKLLGMEGFHKGMDLYFERYDGKAVCCDDFRSAMADANEVDLTQFERWYLQAGTPVVKVVSAAWLPASNEYKLKFRQSTPPTPGQPDKLPLHIPIAVGLIGKTSKKDVVPETLLELKEAEQEFVISNVTEDVVPSILRDFTAPVSLVHELSDDDLAFLMAYDTDPFNKWEAGQKLMTDYIISHAKKIQLSPSRTPEASPLPAQIVKAFDHAFKHTEDLQFASLLILPPTEATLALEMNPTDPRAIHEARKSFKAQVYEALAAEFLEVYARLTQDIDSAVGHFEVTSKAAGRRALRNAILSYIALDKDQTKAIGIAAKQYTTADNMTDKTGAIGQLVNLPSKEKDAALLDFYQTAKGDPNVLNKWFAVQASADIPDVLEVVKKLQAHPDFDISNPNRLRSLVHSFAANKAHFHHPDGSGYKYIANVAIEVDKLNASAAASLCNPLIQWKRYESAAQNLMKAELQRILKTPGLSKDTFEIASKGLKA